MSSTRRRKHAQLVSRERAMKIAWRIRNRFICQSRRAGPSQHMARAIVQTALAIHRAFSTLPTPLAHAMAAAITAAGAANVWALKMTSFKGKQSG